MSDDLTLPSDIVSNTPVCATSTAVFANRDPLPAPVREQVATLPQSDRLAGLRLGVKDLFHIAGLPTAAGNPDWLNTHPLPNVTHTAVLQLLAAGAHYCGKTQTDELAYSLNGSNMHYGTAPNPRAPGCIAGGSSSGAAAATAGNLIDIGLGTDTGGSIRVPASYTGLFGLRTTQGAITNAEMVPLAPRFDTVGWMTRDLNSLIAVGEVLLQGEAFAPKKNELRIAIIEPQSDGERLWSGEHEQWLSNQFCEGKFTRIALDSQWLASASAAFRTLQGRAISATHGQWIGATQPRFAPDIAARFDWALGLSEDEEIAARAAQLRISAQIKRWWDSADIVLLPTTPGAAPALNASASWWDGYRSQLMGLTAIAGLAGLPQLHLPVLGGADAPRGVSLLGPPHSDKTLMQIARYLC